VRLSAVQKLQTSGGIAHPPTDLFPRPPLWVEEALAVDAQQTAASTTVQAISSGPLLLLTTTVPEASAMSADTLRTRVSEAYARIGEALATFQRKPIRFWNFIPDPGRAMGGGLDRYMIFNTGRAEGYAQWCGASRDLGPSLATASTVGITEDELVIHCLASDAGGTAVENPRQKPAWQYSPRYGPMPPCFSRATDAVVAGRRLLLIGGTASIVGEDSQHCGDVAGQLTETLTNLEALIGAAQGPSAGGCARWRTGRRCG